MNMTWFFDQLGRGVRLAALAGAVGLTACGGGGGGGGDGVGSGGTGSFAVGPISGFGSVIVNGIRYDDSGADVFDDDGNAVTANDLRLGMVIEVTGSELASTATGPTANASSIRFSSEIVGPVEAVDVTAGTLKVLGQDVDVTATTVYDEDLSGRLAAVQVGQIVEVYGLGNGSGRYTATRIELKNPDRDNYRLRGPVRELDTQAQTFRIGEALISYADLPDSETPALVDGQLVRVRLEPVPVNGAYVTQRLRGGERRVEDRDEAEIEGLVSSVEAGNPRRFSVDGIPVEASDAEFDNGTPADLAVGVRVEVEGRLEAGVLIAREVEFEDDDGGSEIELSGQIQSLDTVNQTFGLRGLTVSYAGDVRFDDGTAANLGNDVAVEVKGRLAPDGVTVQAFEIEFDD
ncbi:DUF5666 domain-containing protein [Methylibium sp.]|uniref:DUF5666 domain-containing protein n=1 Tax=Methylibium sp. TaxID=2067992 RepID=UPI0017901B01|nr:DUF5666 domain-containing protein [Methylibium sp.]MBA3590613.1 hypothetical protein [Methylibium sp.]